MRQGKLLITFTLDKVMRMPSLRLTYFLAFLATCSMLAVAAYLQYVKGYAPCPLCSLQRVIFIILAVVLAIASLGCGKKFINLSSAALGILLSITGMVFAGRQAFLQHFPAQNGGEGGCGVSLDYMLHVLPIQTVLKKVLIGGTECAQVTWRFLGLSLADLSFISFGAMLLLMLWQWRVSIKL